MKSGKLSYRLTPVYVAISLAMAVPYAQADCTKGNKTSCYSLLSSGQINFDLPDVNQDQGLSDWNPHYTVAKNNTINTKLNDYAVQIINNDLAMNDNNSVVSKYVLDIIEKAENRAKADNSLIINGGQHVVMNAKTNSAINIAANKVVVRTTGNESKGIYYLDHSDSSPQPFKNDDHAGISITTVGLSSSNAKSDNATVANNGAHADRLKVNASVLANIDVSPQNSLQHLDSNNASSETVANSSKIQISDRSAQAVKAFNGDSGIVTFYNSGQLESVKGFSSLVYSDTRPVTIANTLGAETVSGVYARLLENDNVTIHNAATIIGEFNIADQSAYISNLNIYDRETTNSLGALGNAALINKSTARKTFQIDKDKTNGIVSVQNLNYITSKNNKLIATRLFDRFSNIDKPGAIQVGFQVKNKILSGLEKSSADSDGMINIRADKNSIGKRVQLRGNYVVNNNLPYFDAKPGDDEGNITGNITIYDANSTKVYVNNTTIYFDGDQAVGGIDVVDVGENSAGLGSLELGHIIRASQYKQYDSSQISSSNDNVNLVSFSGTVIKTEKDKKPKLGA